MLARAHRITAGAGLQAITHAPRYPTSSADVLASLAVYSMSHLRVYAALLYIGKHFAYQALDEFSVVGQNDPRARHCNPMHRAWQRRDSLCVAGSSERYRHDRAR